MIAADTSVLVASFASWHEHHAAAVAAVERMDAVVAHCLIETYSVLTRMPPPYRIAADVAARFVGEAFTDHTLFVLSATDLRRVITGCATRGITGGAVYDAMIAATCVRRGLLLLTLDERAQPTYARMGASYELIA